MALWFWRLSANPRRTNERNRKCEINITHIFRQQKNAQHRSVSRQGAFEELRLCLYTQSLHAFFSDEACLMSLILNENASFSLQLWCLKRLILSHFPVSLSTSCITNCDYSSVRMVRIECAMTRKWSEAKGPAVFKTHLQASPLA